MNRPVYEAKHNRGAQERVMRRLRELKPGWQFEMSDRLAKLPWDAKFWCITQRVRWYEVKVRHRPWAGLIEREGYLISTRKVHDLMRLAVGSDLWGIVVDCPDGLFVLTRDASLPDGVECRAGGRRDRGDPYDIEMCYFIPARCFIRVAESVNHAKPEGDMLV